MSGDGCFFALVVFNAKTESKARGGCLSVGLFAVLWSDRSFHHPEAHTDRGARSPQSFATRKTDLSSVKLR